MPSSRSIKKILENIGEGFFLKKNNNISVDKFEIFKEDPIDVIFAKKLNNSGGKFFYCKDKNNIENVLKKLIHYLKINNLYCIDTALQKTLHSIEVKFKSENEQACEAMITTCEHIIADQGKILLSSEQVKNKNIKTLPNELIVISYASQIVLRINDAMRSITKKYRSKNLSNITTIGNVEKTNKNLTIGNKKHLNVIVVEDFKL